MILCPLMAAVTPIDEAKSFHTFRFTTLEQQGCLSSLYEKMHYTYEKISLIVVIRPKNLRRAPLKLKIKRRPNRPLLWYPSLALCLSAAPAPVLTLRLRKQYLVLKQPQVASVPSSVGDETASMSNTGTTVVPTNQLLFEIAVSPNPSNVTAVSTSSPENKIFVLKVESPHFQFSSNESLLFSSAASATITSETAPIGSTASGFGTSIFGAAPASSSPFGGTSSVFGASLRLIPLVEVQGQFLQVLLARGLAPPKQLRVALVNLLASGLRLVLGKQLREMQRFPLLSDKPPPSEGASLGLLRAPRQAVLPAFSALQWLLVRSVVILLLQPPQQAAAFLGLQLLQLCNGVQVHLALVL